MKYSILFFSLMCLITQAQAQFKITGRVHNTEGYPIEGASVGWQGTTKFVMTDSVGGFTIDKPDTLKTRHLEVSYFSYETVILSVFGSELQLDIEISGVATTEIINITAQRRNSSFNTINALNSEVIGEAELRKAACCNLSECFENNTVVSLGTADAVSGVREIEMLGLRGIYTSLALEGRPALGGIAQAYSLEYIPGTWLENIQVAKGATGVTAGPRAIAGQINVDLKKPTKFDTPVYLNLFASHIGRLEANAVLLKRLNATWGIGLLAHANVLKNSIDHNHDSFLDVPHKQQVNLMPRLFFNTPKWQGQFSVQALWDERQGGQTNDILHHLVANLYQLKTETNRQEAIAKMAYTGFLNPLRTIGLQMSMANHSTFANFTKNQYNGQQLNGYANLIFDNPLSANKTHLLRLGASINYDNYKETFNAVAYDRTDLMPGVFAEYNLSLSHQGKDFDWLNVVAGVRADYLDISANNYLKANNLYLTPRLQVKYSPTKRIAFRASAGTGLRTPSVFADNFSYMANNRDFVISGILEPERAINYTLNYTHSYRWLQKDVSLSLDVYQTNFFSSIVADPFAQNDKTIVKSEQNNSRANGLVFTIIQELPANLELKLGYKYTNSEALLANSWQQRPLLPVHRALANLHYRSINKRWEVSTTLQYVGSQTLAPIIGNVTTDLPEYRLTQKAPAYLQLLAQVTYNFPWGLEVYLGGENLTNYTQYQPIAGWELSGSPNAPAFDASQIWAPIMGRMFYVGMRYKLPSSKLGSMTHLDIKTSAQCNMCKEYIETALKKIKGVNEAKLNLATKEVEVVYDSKLCTPEMLKKAISEVGYQADEVAPNKAIYDKLPECCKHP